MWKLKQGRSHLEEPHDREEHRLIGNKNQTGSALACPKLTRTRRKFLNFRTGCTLLVIFPSFAFICVMQRCVCVIFSSCHFPVNLHLTCRYLLIDVCCTTKTCTGPNQCWLKILGRFNFCQWVVYVREVVCVVCYGPRIQCVVCPNVARGPLGRSMMGKPLKANLAVLAAFSTSGRPVGRLVSGGGVVAFGETGLTAWNEACNEICNYVIFTNAESRSGRELGSAGGRPRRWFIPACLDLAGLFMATAGSLSPGLKDKWWMRWVRLVVWQVSKATLQTLQKLIWRFKTALGAFLSFVCNATCNKNTQDIITDRTDDSTHTLTWNMGFVQ